MRRCRVVLTILAAASAGSLTCALASAAPSQKAEPRVQVSAQMDRTTLVVGEQLTLTITISGDLQGIELRPFEFPSAFRVVAQSRSTNLSMERGQIQRSIHLIYALVALEPGTFQLGPFTITHRGESHLTEPLEIVVNKPVLPPKLKPGERFTL